MEESKKAERNRIKNEVETHEKKKKRERDREESFNLNYHAIIDRCEISFGRPAL